MSGKKIDVLQLSSMIAAVGSHEIQRLLCKYHHDSKNSVEHVRIAGEKGDEVELGRAIHSLKGVSSNLGFSAVTYFLDQIRTGSAKQDIDISSLELEIHASLMEAQELVSSFN
ncbi:Hpt domain-containing protein [Tritonibacter scottomollicae]|uniref:Hpt domain-containing protein n=1 Tax=Tritonibacter scottomollicae TaxID=483013 RepID=UPI003BAB2EF5